jgi:hypothetical protein
MSSPSRSTSTSISGLSSSFKYVLLFSSSSIYVSRAMKRISFVSLSLVIRRYVFLIGIQILLLSVELSSLFNLSLLVIFEMEYSSSFYFYFFIRTFSNKVSYFSTIKTFKGNLTFVFV